MSSIITFFLAKDDEVSGAELVEQAVVHAYGDDEQRDRRDLRTRGGPSGDPDSRPPAPGAHSARLSTRARITATSFLAVSHSVHSRRRRHRGRRFFECAGNRERI